MRGLTVAVVAACCIALAGCGASGISSGAPPPPSSGKASQTTARPATSTRSLVPTPATPHTSSAPSPATTPALPVVDSPASAGDVCAATAQDQYEICFAYVFNATLLARVPFYLSSRSAAPGFYDAFQEGCDGHNLGQAAKCRLWSRYYRAARPALEQQVAGWPSDVHVDYPHIRIVSVKADLTTGTATILTRETWRVTAGGKVLLAETNQPHTVTLRQVRGLFLHKWVVTSIT
jgi:hypothetical protein